MRQDQFDAFMPIVSADIVAMIVAKRGVSESEAISLLYASEVYEVLEQEETKLWYYSTPMLYSLLEQEWENGIIHYPDV